MPARHSARRFGAKLSPGGQRARELAFSGRQSKGAGLSQCSVPRYDGREYRLSPKMRPKPDRNKRGSAATIGNRASSQSFACQPLVGFGPFRRP